MAISGDSLKIRKFWDDDTKQMVEVELKVRDIIFFKLLERIATRIK